jgi:diacylglycerol kinase (ATP)
MLIVRNPVAGRGRGSRDWSAMRLLIDSHPDREHWHVLDLPTQIPTDASAFARKASEDGIDLVVSCGGDGTLMGVVHGIMESAPSDPGNPPRLGILPLGTGNDFSRTLGIGTDLAKAAECLYRGDPIPIDVGTWSCAAGSGHFLNVAGCGFDACVAERINRGFRRVGGTLAYVLAVMQTLAHYRPTEMTIDADGRRTRLRAMLCAAANGTSYGGGMKVAPDARLDDGKLDVVTVGDIGTLDFLLTFPKVFQGAHLSHPKVQVITAHQVTVDAERPLPVLADGELVGETPATFSVIPAALLAMAPARNGPSRRAQPEDAAGVAGSGP